MRTLVVAALYPWPPVDGYRQRLTNVIAGLCRTGPVDVVAPRRALDPEPAPAPYPEVADAVAVAHPPPRPLSGWAPEWLRSGLPRRALAHDWSAVRAELSQRRDGCRYDLVWYSIIDTWAHTHDLFRGYPSIVDVDNLDDRTLRLRRRVGPRPVGGALGRVRELGRWAAASGLDAVDERRFRALFEQASESAARIVVCSDLDVKRSGLPNAVAVPNGGDAPPNPVVDRRRLRGERPVLGFVGNLAYQPNRDAVEWFVAEVLPIVRTHRPDVRLRLVGIGAEAVAGVAGRAGVELVGRVEDLRPELDATDVSVVPIRIGAGTRLKVVEALAHHIPVVTTTVGCEGIDVVDGYSALIADDPRSFADACLRAVADGELRQRLADAGAELFWSRYRWDAIRDRVAELAVDVARSSQSL